MVTDRCGENVRERHCSRLIVNGVSEQDTPDVRNTANQTRKSSFQAEGTAGAKAWKEQSGCGMVAGWQKEGCTEAL